MLFDRSAQSNRVLEERDVTEEDNDDEDDIRFVTLESRFEKKESLKLLNYKCHAFYVRKL